MDSLCCDADINDRNSFVPSFFCSSIFLSPHTSPYLPLLHPDNISSVLSELLEPGLGFVLVMKWPFFIMNLKKKELSNISSAHTL